MAGGFFFLPCIAARPAIRHFVFPLLRTLSGYGMNSSPANPFPEMALVEQALHAVGLEDIENRVNTLLNNLPGDRRGRPGESVAVAVGSRHIDRIDKVLRATLRFLEQCGLKPFIVPAMGSHGGATADGQRAVLAGYGITEKTMGVPVLPEMDTVEVCRLPDGFPLYISATALLADHIVLINRIKPHTKFKAPVESGLCKMLTVGLGKHVGAAAYHRYAARNGFGVIETAARILAGKIDLLFGIGLIEDGDGRLAMIEPVLPEQLIDREKALLKIASDMLGRIFFNEIDVLIVDFIGKDISGIGMDSNVTGRHRDLVGDFLLPPRPRRIFVRDLSPGSDGNGNGIGLADITTRRLVRRLDMEKTFVNAVTAISPEKAAIPIHFDTDRKCLEVAIDTSGVASADTARIVRIRHTGALRFIQVSKALENDLEKEPRLKRIGPWGSMPFDDAGNLLDF